ncbi:putative disease resistance protein RGA3 [Vicia villosa]|uniref:putative disease resistance protein RGA3 n=1 Tax=Vicia villosa TaxID=3911 RepID=UPI00273BDC48|nr:putative disease resistance protein RGA3 [Vicia villosa]
MAESFVFDIANSLLGKLASYAYEEVSRAYGVYDDLQQFKDTLSIVKGILLDAEYKKDKMHGLREWMRQIQNICSDAEDLFDGFEFQHNKKQVVQASNSTRTKVRHFFSFSNPIVFRSRMAYQIKEIRDRLDKVAADGNKFGLTNIDIGPELVLQRRELTHSHVDASDVIGRENDREEIIKLLMQPYPKDDDGDKSLCVIPIVGIGGLGKTTLAKFVFNDKRMDDQLFQLKMWVCISDYDDFDIKQIIIKIINAASASIFNPNSDPPSVTLDHQENINNLDIEQLQSRLRHKLFGQKFLLVLDDIWNDDRGKWIELINLIKVGATGSQIIVTTRSNSIASMTGTIPSSYVLKGLSRDDCLSLFVKWAFKEGEQDKYPNLVEIGKEIVKKCAGVPLAVRTLGSSLFSKYDLNKWIFVKDSELWDIVQKKDGILPALKLSYDQMPSYLKQCFVYFSLYPKDYTFNSNDIARLWVALRLVQSRNGGENLMDIAREYIDELNSRSFIQDFKSLGYFVTFKVHALIHDLARYVAKEECVAVDSRTMNIPEHVRHLSVVENNSVDNVLFPKSKSLRTILFPIKVEGLDQGTLLDTWISRYKYLRYLDLRYSSFETLPNSFSKLKHLRYLDLCYNKKIRRLSYSICKLHNLQVLKLIGCMGLETLPQWLGSLISLRELFITTKQSIMPLALFTNLNHLQLLVFYKCHNMKFLFSETQRLTSVETLIVELCGSLVSLPLFIFPKLKTLVVSKCQMVDLSLYNENPIQRFMMNHLYIARLTGLLTIPSWIEGVVDTLETLQVYELPNLTTLPECLTTMTRLKRLWISCCPQLSSLPSDFHCLAALEHLYIYDCPELYLKCQPKSGEYWPMIARMEITSIEILQREVKE